MQNLQNGRVLTTTVATPYEMMPASDVVDFHQDALKGIHYKSTLNDTFFSKENIDAVQHGVRYLVWLNSCKKHIIDRQSDEELKTVMRSVYLQYAKNQPFNILEQVKELNAKVLEYAVNNIINEINIYLKYKQDISSLPVPLERAPNTSSKGGKTLEIKSFF